MIKYYTIGEMASIFKMDVQMLRHYDAKGLLTPAIRDIKNNYRMYDINQVLQLATIRYLRKLSYTHKNIKEFMQAKDFSETIETLRKQSEILHKQSADLNKAATIIQEKIVFIETETKNWKIDEYSIKKCPEREFVQIGTSNSIFTNELYYLYPTICFYKGEQKNFGAYLFNERDDSPIIDMEEDFEISTIKAGEFLCGYHVGTYQTILNSINKLREYGSDKKLDDETLTINILDQFVESRPENYVTELQMRIL